MSPAPPRARTARRILQGIGLVYLIAFVSLAVQIQGLYGRLGILPASDYLHSLGERLGAAAMRAHPTLFWYGSSDEVLVGACWLGAVAAGLLMAGVMPTLSALACWILYFSLFQIGRVFLSFQWDILLLEAGFLAIFLAPLRLRQHADYDPEPSPVVIWMFRWLLFRLMFASGVVKLLSNDPVWWNLSALEYHYWTQPLPTATAWIVQQFPALLHRVSTLIMFVIELGVPWFIFGPRRLRVAAFGVFVAFQGIIAATGNYTYFNLLTVVLCLSLLDDDALSAGKLRSPGEFFGRWPGEPRRWTVPMTLGTALFGLLALPLATAGGALMVARFGGSDLLPAPITRLVTALQPYHLTSSYGLFSVMTRHRSEIVLQGSDDGIEWRDYEFRWKPGDVTKMPAFVAPHQPRLDWQMWFAALDDWRRSPWLTAVERRLLMNSPEVLALFANDPFSGMPPRHVRAMLYEYQFTDWTVWSETGAWWRRRLVGQFSPTISR